jgi:cell division protein FtsI/penicillin-binding protein 2
VKVGHRPKKANYKKRALVLLVMALAGFLILVARALIIQAVNPEYYIEKARLGLTQKRPLAAKRGDIEDRNGNKLAVTDPLKKICVRAEWIKNKRKVAKVLARHLNLDERQILEKLVNEKGYLELANKVKPDLAEKIKSEAKEHFLWVEDDFLRVYPYHRLASHVIGYVGKKVDQQTGLYEGREGIEYYYNDLLQGTPGYIVAQFFSKEEAIVPYTVVEKKEPKDGMNLVLTLDKDIQYFVEASLKEVVSQQEATAACAIVMESKTGEILAMASYPDFDPNLYEKTGSETNFLNRCFRAVYEPGSTFKTVTIAGAINEGLISPESVFYLPEKIKIGRYTIREAHHRPAGSYTVTQIFEQSMNIGAVKIAEKLGPQKFYEYISSFGFGSKTGIDLNGEQEGRVLPPEDWKKTTMATMSFGQGIACTPLQVLVATNVFASDGYYVRPHLFRYAYDPETEALQDWETERPVKIVSDSTVNIMRELLQKVVKEGTGQKAKIPGYTVAGKTGTAQVPGKRGYQKGKYVSSFVGFLPATDPKLSIIVVVYEPKKDHYGGAVAAPVFAKIAAFSAKHLKIPPDEDLSGQKEDLKNSITVTGD